MRCAEVKEKIYGLILGILEKDEEKGVLDHLERCEECKKIYETEEKLEEDLKNIPVVSPPLSLRFEILRRIEEKKEHRVKPILRTAFRWAPVFASLVILLLFIFLPKGEKVEFLEASVFQMDLLVPKEGSTFFTDNVKIVATISPATENIDIEAYLDERDISELFEVIDGVLIYMPPHLEEGYHRIQIMAKDQSGKLLEKLESVFYTVGG